MQLPSFARFEPPINRAPNGPLSIVSLSLSLSGATSSLLFPPLICLNRSLLELPAGGPLESHRSVARASSTMREPDKDAFGGFAVASWWKKLVSVERFFNWPLNSRSAKLKRKRAGESPIGSDQSRSERVSASIVSRLKRIVRIVSRFSPSAIFSPLPSFAAYLERPERQ